MNPQKIEFAILVKILPKSLTLAVPILKMIGEGLTESEIAKAVKLSKQSVSYHVSKLKGCGYIKEIGGDVFKLFELTQTGKNFLAMFQWKDP